MNYYEMECPHCEEINLCNNNYCGYCGGALHKKDGKFVDPYNKCREDGINTYELLNHKDN